MVASPAAQNAKLSSGVTATAVYGLLASTAQFCGQEKQMKGRLTTVNMAVSRTCVYVCAPPRGELLSCGSALLPFSSFPSFCFAYARIGVAGFRPQHSSTVARSRQEASTSGTQRHVAHWLVRGCVPEQWQHVLPPPQVPPAHGKIERA